MILYSRVCRPDNTVPCTDAVCSVSSCAISAFQPDTVVWCRTRTTCEPSGDTAERGTDFRCRRLCCCSPALCIHRACCRPAARFPIWCTCCRDFENRLPELPPYRRILWRKPKTQYYINKDKPRQVVGSRYTKNNRWTLARAEQRRRRRRCTRRHAVTNARPLPPPSTANKNLKVAFENIATARQRWWCAYTLRVL